MNVRQSRPRHGPAVAGCARLENAVPSRPATIDERTRTDAVPLVVDFSVISGIQTAKVAQYGGGN